MWVWWVLGGCVLLPQVPDGFGYDCDEENPCPDDLICVVDEWSGDVTPSCQVPCQEHGDCQFRDSLLNSCAGFCAFMPYE